ncbi:ClpXP protease specificity-enhancing factor [Methylobacter sp. Wu8]|jgi:stringent starvation protein B|uniref:ClpXP protease specificity-enhancing factor n=1 Tax=Methylobacter sp. Wu8 TaxID=3118457 RepID=UPI002F302DEE|nr:ClpXP protease specificity-enhancing factor [Methylobacter tundripaludum]MCK9637320.1 ClpXP protease specificity-enhancing factor [Methylobacter tundripaludum]
MTSLKPYLIRSIYEWIIDNSLTPHLLVDAENAGAILPTEFIEDGKIILNIRPEAIQGLSLGNEEIEFNARFSGKPMHIVTPVTAVLAIYAKENGKGMIFDPEDNEDDEPPPPVKKPTSKPNLRIVK